MHVTHYHLPDRAPFLNLSDLGSVEQLAVVSDLLAQRAEGRQHRPFGQPYLELRRRVERRLRDAFVERGGRPEREAPHYFVLGDSAWFRRLAPGMKAVRFELSALPPDATSITYPDSFVAFGDEPPDDERLRRHHRHVYLLDEIDDLTSDNPVPDPAWRPEHAVDWTTWPAATFVEVQLWTDAPVRHLLPG